MSADSAAGRFHDDLGVWIRMGEPVLGGPRPALFLDRDGVIVEDPGYLARAVDVVMIPGAAEIIAAANQLGIPVVEVTNQAGIGRGYYGWDDFIEVEAAVERALARHDARIDAVLACPYHPDGIGPWAHPAHPARKPGPGMLLAAGKMLDLDLRRSWIVGDNVADLNAGRAAGLRGGLHVLTGHGWTHRQAVLARPPDGFEILLGESVRETAWVLETIVSYNAYHS